MIEYMIVEGPKYGSAFTNSFDFSIKNALDEGWRPQGGLVYLHEERLYLQAMIRETEG